MKKPTIYTLAEELGVNPATVSRALNNSPKISEQRRREIKELAKKRGFKLRDFAPRLTNLCVLICTSADHEPIFSSYTDQVINGVNQYCTEHDLELSIFSSSRQKLNRNNVVKELFRRNVDGVIVINANSDCKFIADFEHEKLAYCCLLAGNPQFPANTLTVNNEDLAEKAIEYLIGQGHRHIAFLYSAPNNQAQTDRLGGYRTALKKAGLAINKAYISSVPTRKKVTGIEYGFQATTNLLNECPEVTALFASSSDLADGARSAIYRKKMNIPGDISLIGCDDSPQAEYFCPPLTVIDIPNVRLGQTAAAWIHHKIEGTASPHPPKEPWMEGHLIIRESTAAPRSGR